MGEELETWVQFGLHVLGMSLCPDISFSNTCWENKEQKSNAPNVPEIKGIIGQGDNVSPAIFTLALVKDQDLQV